MWSLRRQNDHKSHLSQTSNTQNLATDVELKTSRGCFAFKNPQCLQPMILAKISQPVAYLELKTSCSWFGSKMGSNLCNCWLALASARFFVLIQENVHTGHQSKTIKLNESLHKPSVLLECTTGRQCDWKIKPLINGTFAQKANNISPLDGFSQPEALWRNMQLNPFWQRFKNTWLIWSRRPHAFLSLPKSCQNPAVVGWYLLQHGLMFWSKKRTAQVICLQLWNSINIGTSPLSCWSVKLVDNTTERSNRWSVDLLPEKHRISACLINSDGLKLRDTTFSWNPACKDSRTGPFPELKTSRVCFALQNWVKT